MAYKTKILNFKDDEVVKPTISTGGTTGNPPAVTAGNNPSATAEAETAKLFEEYRKLNDDMYSAKKQQYDAEIQRYFDAMNAEKAGLYSEYSKARSDAYTTAKQTQLGINEGLAAQGLAGNLYGSPTSGISETSRLQQGLNLQNIYAGLNAEERTAVSALNNLIMQSKKEQSAYQTSLDLEYRKSDMELRQEEKDALQTQQTSQAALINSGMSYISYATDISDLQAYMKLVGADDATTKKITDYYVSNRVSTGEATLDEVKAYYGEGTEGYRLAVGKIQKSNADTILNRLTNASGTIRTQSIEVADGLYEDGLISKEQYGEIIKKLFD